MMALLTIQQHYKNGRFQLGFNACQQAEKTQAENPKLWTLKGLCAQGLGDMATASAAFEQALQLSPNDDSIRYNLAVAKLQLGETNHARSLFETLAADSQQPAVLVNLALCYSQENEHERALHTLGQINEIAANDPQIILQHALILERAGRFDEARQRLLSIQNNNATTIPVGMLIARLTQKLEGASKAADFLASYIGTVGPDPVLIVEQGRCLMESGRNDLALSLFRQTVDAGVSDGRVLNGMGVALSRLNRKAEAKETFKKATEENPNDPNVLFNLAAELSKATDNEELKRAATLLNRSIQLQGNNPGAHDCLAKVSLKLGQTSQAIDAASTAVAMEPTLAENHITLAECHFAFGNHEQSIAALDKGIKAAGAHSQLLRQAGIARLRAGTDLEQAESLLQKAYRADPSDQRTIAHVAVAMSANEKQKIAADWIGLNRHIYPVRFQNVEGFEDIKSFNQALANDIVNHSLMRWEPVGLAARGGGLTDDLLADDTPAIRAFYKALSQAISQLQQRLVPHKDDPFTRSIPRDYRLELWATLTQEGGNIDTHIHEESWISGAYYVQLPDCVANSEDHQGWIEFGRPHAEIAMPKGTQLRLEQPEEGTLLLFPSFLFHRTIPHDNSQRRISISFDLIPNGEIVR